MNKFQAISAAITMLQSQEYYYSWHDHTTCNVGTLLLAATGQSIQQSREIFQSQVTNRYIDNWDKAIRIMNESGNFQICSVTGLPVDSLLAPLQAIGFTQQDLSDLEMLSNPQILDGLGVTSLNHRERVDVVRYLKEWQRQLTPVYQPVSNLLEQKHKITQTVSLAI